MGWKGGEKMKKFLIGVSSALVGLALFAGPVFADSVSVDFENPAYVPGSINGQDGWTSLGSVGSGCAVYDHAVASQSAYHEFGSQSLRISDAATSGCFGDQTFAKPLTDAVGEADSTDGTFSRGTLQRHFETQFSLGSVLPNLFQPGMHVSVSPDRGDGSRMSYLRFEDNVTGIDVFFDDVQGTTNPANFVETQIAAGLNRTTPHVFKLTMDLVDGPSNDVVKVYLDGALVHSGTTWENYYRYDSEASAEQSPRIVKTVIFRTSDLANTANAGKEFLFDSFSLLSGPVLIGPPTDRNQCRHDGWKTFNNPSFHSQRECIAFVDAHSGHR